MAATSLSAQEKSFWQIQMDTYSRSTKTMMKNKDDLAIEEMEDAISKLESEIGPIIFEQHTGGVYFHLHLRNTLRLKALAQAIAPFHRVFLKNAKILSTKIERESAVDSVAFRNIDRALFGYQAIFRKLLTVEEINSNMKESSQNSIEQIYAAKSLAMIIANDIYTELFLTKKTRLMFTDLLNEERPLAKSYKDRNKELHAQFLRALDNEVRADVSLNINNIAYNIQPLLSPFSLESAKKVASDKKAGLYLSFSDEVANSIQAATYQLSKIFGKVVGNIKFRRGHFWLRRDVTKYMANNLRPFDILFDKAPFGLSDRFIPGHYTHAAIYLGTKAQLQSAGLWDHPALGPYRKEIEEGKVIVEALRPGTKMSYLHEFQNVDEIAAYRVKGILDDPVKLQVSLDTLMAQIGKDYDFNFDVSTTSSIVCSELVYHSIAQIKWPTEQKVGRETISPDNLAVLAFYDNAPTELVFDIYAEEAGEFKERSTEQVGELLGFARVGENNYEKIGQFCYNEVQSHIRVGSRRTRHLEMRKCSETSTPLVYK